MTEPNTTALIEIEKINAAELFVEDQKPLDTLLDKIKTLTAGQVPDLETLKGRDEIAALAYRVTRSKTALDKAGMALNAERAKQTKIVNAARKRVVTFCDTLRDEIRQPLTAWEEEQARISAEEERLAKIELDHGEALEMNDLFDRELEMKRQEAEMKQREADMKAREEAIKQAEPEPETPEPSAIGLSSRAFIAGDQAPEAEPEPENHISTGPNGLPPDESPPRTSPAADTPTRDNAGFIQLRGALRVDSEYSHSWHCNLAMSFLDAIEASEVKIMIIPPGSEGYVDGDTHAIVNDGATRFMKLAFGVDTSA